MNTEQIGTEVQQQLKNLLITIGVDGFEFGITQQISTTVPFSKITMWYHTNPKDLERIYKGCCDLLRLPFNENATGQFLFIKIKN